MKAPAANAAPRLRNIDLAALEDILALEKICHAHPWTRGQFEDSLRMGYWAQMLVSEAGAVLAYVLAMPGVSETHLLNLTVAPAHQGCGWGRLLLAQWADWSQRQGAPTLWLEVRASNARALRLYQAFGFVQQAERKGYYPGLGQQREAARVLRLVLDGGKMPS